MSIKGRKKALENACGEPLSGKNKVAYYLSTAGIPVGIVMTAVAALYWLIYIIWIGLIIFGVGKGGISAAVSALLR